MTSSLLKRILFVGALSTLPGCGDYSECVIRGLKEAHTDRAVSLIEEMCAKRFETTLYASEAARVIGKANISNPYKDKSTKVDSNQKQDNKDGEFEKFIRGHVKFSATIKNDTFDWRITGLVVRVVLDKEKNLSETHTVHVLIPPGVQIELEDIKIDQLAEIRKDNWEWDIKRVYGVRLTPKYPIPVLGFL